MSFFIARLLQLYKAPGSLAAAGLKALLLFSFHSYLQFRLFEAGCEIEPQNARRKSLS
jgi:hypothetical protein